jgi:serine/threonine-protein kinase
MASLIVEEIMFQYTPQSPQELVNALAEQIPDPQKAMQFKQRLFS